MSKSKYFAVVTDLGNELMLKAVADGVKVNICTFAVGDGNGAYYEPQTTMTQLKAEKWRGDINSCEISKESENVLIVSALCPGDVGGFTIREMAVFDDQDRMIAICNTPDTPKVKITEGVVNEMRLELEIVLINGASVELVIDPNIVTATKKDVEEVWDYLKETGKVVIGKRNLKIEENDICVVVDEVDWPEKKIFLIVDYILLNYFWSDDAVRWEEIPSRESGNDSMYPPNLTYGNGKFVYVGNNGAVECSYDGRAWARVQTLSDGTLGGIIYTSDRFIIVGVNGATFISYDGFIWTKGGKIEGLKNIYGLAYGNNMVVCDTYYGIYQSTSGETWNKVCDFDGSGRRGGGYTASYANGIFVCMINSIIQSTTRMYYSSDGLNWNHTVLNYNAELLCAANDRFYCIHSYIDPGSIKNTILCSYNGRDWNNIQIKGLSENTYEIKDICYSGGIYYCITRNNFYVSKDGINFIKKSEIPKIYNTLVKLFINF